MTALLPPPEERKDLLMKEPLLRTLPRTTMKEWAVLLSFVPVLLGLGLTIFFSMEIFRKIGVSAREVVPFVLGILLLSWAPLFIVRGELLDLRARVRTLEDERAQGK
jgi:hypothetical protein